MDENANRNKKETKMRQKRDISETLGILFVRQIKCNMRICTEKTAYTITDYT